MDIQGEKRAGLNPALSPYVAYVQYVPLIQSKNWQAEIDKQRLQSQIEAERAVLQNVTAERERVEKQVKQLQGFLTLAEQRQLEETIYTDRDSERF